MATQDVAGIPAPRRDAPAGVAATAGLIVLLLLGLPVSVWMDLRSLSEHTLRTQAQELGHAVNNVRDFYGRNVVGRILAHEGTTRVVHNYTEIPGAVPIPATLSLELGDLVSSRDGSITYRFFSDYPFANRPPHSFDAFERDALAKLRQDPQAAIQEVIGGIFDRRVRVVTPVVMGGACVNCHNRHAESPKRDWKVGDVRGIQEIAIHRPIAANIFAFKFLLIYLACATTFGLAFIVLQHRQAAIIRRFNARLEEANAFLAAVSAKIAKYLSPQLYSSIFSGQKDVVIHTERKKLTIFFSDIVDFTATTERLQPEELASLLNEYLTEMSAIAAKHGGTVDKFIGDAILVFFGDPETKGVAEDASGCLAMALEMQRRLAELNVRWRRLGIEKPFAVRMGINTGFCNVGNFGSDDRMDYTIIGGEANLAARLQSIAAPGRIVLTYETYALVRDVVHARPMAPIQVKGISREIVPYVVEGIAGDMLQEHATVISEQITGLDLFLDTNVIDGPAAARALQVLLDATAALKARQGSAAAAK
jgi:adenylate cyclase